MPSNVFIHIYRGLGSPSVMTNKINLLIDGTSESKPYMYCVMHISSELRLHNTYCTYITLTVLLELLTTIENNDKTRKAAFIFCRRIRVSILRTINYSFYDVRHLPMST